MDEEQDLSKNNQLHTRRRVVVFDIDNTLCKSPIGDSEKKLAREVHPECTIIKWEWYEHFFLPHLQILFDYLLKHGARVAFCSGGTKERNESVIPELLTSFYGSEKYEELRAKGQFNIHSENDLRKTDLNKKAKGEGNYVKDLKNIIRDGESLSDIILVDDDSSYVAFDQYPFIRPMDLTFWYWSKKDEYVYNNHKNGVYYMLGIFKTAFEDEKYTELALKDAVGQILPEKNYLTWKSSMIDVGLSEVQKQVPDARLFGNPNPSKKDASD